MSLYYPDGRPLPWLRLNCDFIHSPRVQRLSEAMQRRYVGLLCLAGQQHLPTDDDGVVEFSLRLTQGETAETKRTLIDAGLIDEKWFPTSFDRYAKPSDHNGRERTQKWREKQATESGAEQRRHSDVTVTDNGTERNGRNGTNVTNGTERNVPTSPQTPRQCQEV